MENEEYAISHAVVLCQDNVQVNGKVVYLPIYMLMFMQPVKGRGRHLQIPTYSVADNKGS